MKETEQSSSLQKDTTVKQTNHCYSNHETLKRRKFLQLESVNTKILGQKTTG
jgi:hypothetical protein